MAFSTKPKYEKKDSTERGRRQKGRGMNQKGDMYIYLYHFIIK